MARQRSPRTIETPKISPGSSDEADGAVESTNGAGTATGSARRAGRPRHGPAVARHLPRDEEILKIAAEVFLRDGVSGTKLDEIARKVGIAKGSLYHYFESKEQIYERIIRGVVERLEEETSAPIEGNAAEALASYVRKRVAVVTENPVETAIIARHLLSMEGEVGEWAQAHRRREWQHLRQILLAGQRESVFRSCNVETLAIFIFDAINGLAEWYRPGGHYGGDEIAHDLIEFILASAGVPAADFGRYG